MESQIRIAADNNRMVPIITCTKKFKVPDQLLTTVKLTLICNYPHYLSVLSRKLESDPTTLIEIAVYRWTLAFASRYAWLRLKLDRIRVIKGKYKSTLLMYSTYMLVFKLAICRQTHLIIVSENW